MSVYWRVGISCISVHFLSIPRAVSPRQELGACLACLGSSWTMFYHRHSLLAFGLNREPFLLELKLKLFCFGKKPIGTILWPLVWINMKQDRPDFQKKNRHHTIHKTITGNEPLILSNTRDKCCRHEIQSSIRNPDKLCLDLRAGGWSHTLNLPKCSTIHIYLLHRSHSHSKPHHPSPPPPHHQVAITAPSTKSRGDREIIHIRYMFLEIHSIKKALYLFLPRSTLVALDCAAQAKRLGKCDRSVVPWFGFLLEMVGLIQLMEDIWLTSWYGKYIM